MVLLQEILRQPKILETLVFFCLFLLMYLTCNFFKKSKSNFPPGPNGLPIVGYIPFLKKFPHLQFTELGKKYGDVFSVKVGSQFVVVLNTADVIKEGYVKPEFQGRPQQNAFAILDRKSPYFDSDNQVWSEHKRLFVLTMKDLGFGTSRIEEQIQEEISHFLAVLRSHNGNPLDPQTPLTPSIANNISALIFDERHSYDHPERKTLDNNMNTIFEMLGQTTYRIFFPLMQYVPFILKSKNLQKLRQASLENRAIFWEKIKQHADTLDPKSIRDYIDKYLVEMNSRKKKNMKTTLSVDALLGSVGDIFGAGSETTRNTILWCIYTMAAYPDVQKKVQAEIMDQIGQERRPEYTDLKLIPYTHAVIMEVMRWKTLVPISILRCTTKDTILRGYTIPKGAILMGNLWNAHHDSKLWLEPDVFVPERFLSEDRLSVWKTQNFMPFSIGKRSCPGEGLANIEIALYFVSIFQEFEVSFPGGLIPTFNGELTITFRPEPYIVHFTPRDVGGH